MKLEYLPQGPHGSGLIRLYEYVPEEVRELKGIAGKLATGAREQISLEGEKWIVPVDGCRLTLQRGDDDFGVRRVGPLSFDLWMAGAASRAYWSNSVIQRQTDFSGSLNGVESLF